MKKIELLAPAGCWDMMKAAIHAGCDAVYAGGKRFGARAFAGNFEEKELLRAIDYVHIRNKKLYLTVNTLLKNEEIQELPMYLEPYYKQGLDAVIVQDMGAVKIIREEFPDLPIHASTQMTVMTGQEARIVAESGVVRIVAPRELNLEEIQEMKLKSGMEIETFIHGALCFCYSGQCLLSSMRGDRSGNRGRCAQPCRLPYHVYSGERDTSLLKKKECYALSPKDICTLNLLPELIEAGIDSFKIEGRMKKAEYAAYVSYVYKKYTELYLELGKEKYNQYIIEHKKQMEEEKCNLADLYNRGGFSQGYYKMHNGMDMMAERPNHNGVRVGIVKKVAGNRAVLLAEKPIFAQDVLEIRKQGEAIYEFTVKEDWKQGEIFETNFFPNCPVCSGDFLYRTRNNQLLTEIAEKLIQKKQLIPVKAFFTAMEGSSMELTLTQEGNSVTVWGQSPEKAKNHPVTGERIKENLRKVKDSCYILQDITLKVEEGLFIPISQINELRREAVKKLEEQITGQFRRKYKRKEENNRDRVFQGYRSKQQTEESSSKGYTESEEKKFCPKIAVHLVDGHLFEFILESEGIDRIYLDIEGMSFEKLRWYAEQTKRKKKQIYYVLPEIFRKKTYDFFYHNRQAFLWASENVKGFLIRGLGEYELLTEKMYPDRQEKEIILDYSVYTLNNHAKVFWAEKGITGDTAPLELSYGELRKLNLEQTDFIAYGCLPLMVSAQCIHKNMDICDKKKTTYYLKDKMGTDYVVKNYCTDCYNVIYNRTPFYLLDEKEKIEHLAPKTIRLDFIWESKKEAEQILAECFSYYAKEDNTAEEERMKKRKKRRKEKTYTTGHFYKKIE